jgi:type III secretory pathway component EscV
VRKVAHAAGPELSAHVLRHTCITKLVRKGSDVVLVAELAGHRRLETTRRYSLPSQADRQLLDPLEALAWRLDGLVRLHLHRFVGLSEVEFQLHEWEIEGEVERYDLIRRALPDKRARVRLVALMRRLVRAHVAVDDLDGILRGIVSAPRDATLAQLEEHARAQLLMSLPGVRDVRDRVDIPPELDPGSTVGRVFGPFLNCDY